MNASTAPVRPVRLGNMAATITRRADGITIVDPIDRLGDYPRSMVDALDGWAKRTPDAVLIADRDGEDWRRLTYADVLSQIPPLAQALLNAGLSPERPLMILSGNEIEHFLLGMAAIWVGIPYAPISPAYSLI